MIETVNESDLSRYLTEAFAACDGASRILNNHFGNLRHVDEKYQAGLVSEADRESEKYIVNHLRKCFPDHTFLGEEFGLSATGPTDRPDPKSPLWIIDPLDGTTNYIHQFPFFCISIGLEIAGRLVLGVVDAPRLGSRYYAVRDQGAFLNGERIHVSKRTKFKDALFATGFSSRDEELEEQLEFLAKTVREARGVRRAGAAALDLCYVAQGVFDVFWEKNLSPWDTAAGVVIATEAGALVSDMQGGVFETRKKSILCGTPALHGEVLRIMNSIHIAHLK